MVYYTGLPTGCFTIATIADQLDITTRGLNHIIKKIGIIPSYHYANMFSETGFIRKIQVRIINSVQLTEIIRYRAKMAPQKFFTVRETASYTGTRTQQIRDIIRALGIEPQRDHNNSMLLTKAQQDHVKTAFELNKSGWVKLDAETEEDPAAKNMFLRWTKKFSVPTQKIDFSDKTFLYLKRGSHTSWIRFKEKNEIIDNDSPVLDKRLYQKAEDLAKILGWMPNEAAMIKAYPDLTWAMAKQAISTAKAINAGRRSRDRLTFD